MSKNNQFQIQRILKYKYGKPLLCSETVQRQYENSIFDKIYGDNCEEIDLPFKDNNDLSKKGACFLIKNIKKFVEVILDIAVEREGFDLQNHIENMKKLHVVVSGDHGGDLKVDPTMKYTIQIFRDKF